MHACSIETNKHNFETNKLTDKNTDAKNLQQQTENK